MNTIIAIGLTLLVSSVLSEEVCVKINHEETQHCSKFKNLKHAMAIKYPIIWDLKLQLKTSNNLTIAPYALQNRHIRSLYIEGLKDLNTPSLSLLQDSFAGMSKLTTLVFRDIDLKVNNANLLVPLGSLLTLVIKGSNLTQVPTQMLASAPKLEDVHLVEDQIGAIRSDSFGLLKSLQNLDFSDNGITHIESGAFDGLSELTHLMLGGNHLGVIPIGLFDDLMSLTYIDLKDCNITTITPGAFGRLRLDLLNLQMNKIKVIETATFKGLFVKKLFLDHNDIEDLEPRAFSGSIVQRLDLTGNKLTKIDTDDFDEFTTRYLALGDNMIRRIDVHALKNVVTKRLDLFGNNMSLISRAELGLPKSVEFPTKEDVDIHMF